ncbi:MAG: tetratricopeptide repeat protein, partial [Acidobacteriota bacterium]
GMAEYELENLENGRVIFRQIAEDRQDTRRRVEAQVMLARTWQVVDRPLRCIEEAGSLVSAGDDLPVGPDAYMVLGDCHRASGDVASALEMYQEAVARSRHRAERFEAQLRVAEALRELGRKEDAGAFYERLMEDEANPVRMARLRIAVGRLRVEDGDVEGGIETLRRVADEPEVKDLPAEAQFEIGRVYEEIVGDMDLAVVAYEEVGKKRPPKELGPKAQERKASAGRMKGLLEKRETASPDSLPIVDFDIAEHYLFSMNRPARALEHYGAVVEEGSNEGLAAKSLLAMAWIREHVENDSTKAAADYERLVELYPETDASDRAREALGLPPRPKPAPPDTAMVGPPVPPLAAPPDTAMVGPPIPPLAEPPDTTMVGPPAPPPAAPQADSLGAAPAVPAPGDSAAPVRIGRPVPADSVSVPADSGRPPARPKSGSASVRPPFVGILDSLATLQDDGSAGRDSVATEPIPAAGRDTVPDGPVSADVDTAEKHIGSPPDTASTPGLEAPVPSEEESHAEAPADST